MQKMFEPRQIIRIALAMFLTISGYSSSSYAAAKPSCDYDFSEVTTMAQELVDTTPLDGASLMVIKDGQVIYEQYFGTYNVSTTVKIASASKWLSAATLMTLVDEGKLNLDDPVSKYLSYFTDDKASITIRQLFSHTSGLPAIQDPVTMKSTDAPCLLDPRMPMDSCVQKIAQLPLIGTPGGQFGYGENSMQVGARICEVVSGDTPWETLFNDRIGVPLGMSSSSFCKLPGCTNPMAGGGAHSGLHDYANFLQMIIGNGTFNGVRILSADSVQEMQRNLTAGLDVYFAPHGLTAVNYGLGEWIDVLENNGSSDVLSSPGVLGFTPWVDKDRNMVGIFMTETKATIYPSVNAIQRKIAEIVDNSCPMKAD